MRVGPIVVGGRGGMYVIFYAVCWGGDAEKCARRLLEVFVEVEGGGLRDPGVCVCGAPGGIHGETRRLQW